MRYFISDCNPDGMHTLLLTDDTGKIQNEIKDALHRVLWPRRGKAHIEWPLDDHLVSVSDPLLNDIAIDSQFSGNEDVYYEISYETMIQHHDGELWPEIKEKIEDAELRG